MTYKKQIKKHLLSGSPISYRAIETQIQCNHPRASLKQAIEELESEGVTVRETQNINVNTNKVYKEWKTSRRHYQNVR